MDFQLVFTVLLGIGLLLFMILKMKLPAFLSLLIVSILVALASGISPVDTMELIKVGMGNTLGFVAVVIGLGAMFGAILEYSGGAEALAQSLLRTFGIKNSNYALMLTGFFVAIPVFFDVAFILLVPLVYALQRKTGRSTLYYAIPLLAGLVITHSFIPPTPGPVAVADILKADLGLVIFFGFIVGIPTVLVAGPMFGKFISKNIFVEAIEFTPSDEYQRPDKLPAAWMIFLIIGIPIFLILLNTFVGSSLTQSLTIPNSLVSFLQFIGHPFSALIIANLIAWYVLGIMRKFSTDELLRITTNSLAPAGIIILLTGAGGVFKEVLIATGAGEMMATYFAEHQVSILFFAFLSAVVVRLLQGSATVAMITAAGLTAPLIPDGYSASALALLVIAVASGSSIFSHVNDSGFWLVSKYLGLSEKQTFKSWSVMTLLISLVSFVLIYLLSFFV